MALTYAQLTQAVQDYLEEAETSFVGNIDVFIKQAEDRILNATRLPEFRRSQYTTLTADNEYLVQPTDFLAPYAMAVDNSGFEYLLLKDVNYIREVYPDKTVTGVPRYYAIFSEDTFILGPTPDNGYTVQLHYMHRPASIVDSGTSWLGDNAESCLLYATLIEAYGYLKGDPDLMQTYDARYQAALSELKDLGEGHTQTDDYRGRFPRRQRG